MFIIWKEYRLTSLKGAKLFKYHNPPVSFKAQFEGHSEWCVCKRFKGSSLKLYSSVENKGTNRNQR